MAHEKGYCVATNKNVIDFVTPCVSTHSKSRPDLVLYHTKHYLIDPTSNADKYNTHLQMLHWRCGLSAVNVAITE